MGPYDVNRKHTINSDADKLTERNFIAHEQWADPVVGAVDAIHNAVTDTSVEVEVLTDITNPDYARGITATAGGTGADIGAIQVVIVGTRNGEVITETLPAFTVDTPGTVQGSKAFDTVTSITIPAHEGTAATTSVGTNDKLGLNYKLAHNTLMKTFLDNTLEGTAATVTVSATVLASNTIDLHSALDGTVVDAYLII